MKTTYLMTSVTTVASKNFKWKCMDPLIRIIIKCAVPMDSSAFLTISFHSCSLVWANPWLLDCKPQCAGHCHPLSSTTFTDVIALEILKFGGLLFHVEPCDLFYCCLKQGMSLDDFLDVIMMIVYKKKVWNIWLLQLAGNYHALHRLQSAC